MSRTDTSGCSSEMRKMILDPRPTRVYYRRIRRGARAEAAAERLRLLRESDRLGPRFVRRARPTGLAALVLEAGPLDVLADAIAREVRRRHIARLAERADGPRSTPGDWKRWKEARAAKSTVSPLRRWKGVQTPGHETRGGTGAARALVAMAAAFAGGMAIPGGMRR